MTTEELIRKGKYYRSRKQFNEAYMCFLEAALNNDPVAIKNLGRCYLHGEGVPQDFHKASYYFDMLKNMPYCDGDACDDCENIDDRRYNFSVGLEPMKPNVFKYMIEDVLKTITYGEDYLSVAYCPVREDGISCIQSQAEETDGLHYLEIIINDDSEKGFNIYAREDLSLMDTIAIYRKVLIEYEMPSILDWEDVTEKVQYVE